MGLAGALLMICAGLVDFSDIHAVVSSNISIFIMLPAMMIISIIVDEAGFFRWAADHSVRLAGGSGKKLFRNTFIMGTIVTTFISNDATALIITPIVYCFVAALGLNPLPYLLVCTFIADTASLSLPVSNLTNLLVYEKMGLEFMPYVISMALPTVTAILVNYAVFRVIFDKKIRGKYEYSEAVLRIDAIKHKPFFYTATAGLALIVAAYVAGSYAGITLVAIAVAGAAALIAAGLLFRQITLKLVFSQVSWNIMIFVFGFFVIVRGIQNTGILSTLASFLISSSGGNLFEAIMYTSAGTAIGSNIINNVPMDMLMISVLKTIPSNDWIEPLSYSVVLGAGLGPNITVIGSLATMLWLGTIRRKGVNITAWQYLKAGLATAPLMIILSAAALWFSVKVFFNY